MLLLLFACNVALAQKQMFAGKVTDENGMAIPGARIKINKGFDLKCETQADKDGLYYSKLLPQGGYNIELIANGKYMKARRVLLHTSGNDKWYYNLHAGAKKLTVDRVKQDPFMKTKLSQIETSGKNTFDMLVPSRGPGLYDNDYSSHLMRAPKQDSVGKR